MIRPPPKSTLFPYPTLSQYNYTNQPPLSAAISDVNMSDLDVGPEIQALLRAAAIIGPRLQYSTPDRKSTRLNSSHANISYAVFCLKKKKKNNTLFYIALNVI